MTARISYFHCYCNLHWSGHVIAIFERNVTFDTSGKMADNQMEYFCRIYGPLGRGTPQTYMKHYICGRVRVNRYTPGVLFLVQGNGNMAEC